MRVIYAKSIKAVKNSGYTKVWFKVNDLWKAILCKFRYIYVSNIARLFSTALLALLKNFWLSVFF